MNFPKPISRPSKYTNAETILYEIDMLRFTADRLEESEGQSAWSNLECFLLHFRNLIEFFGNPQPRGDDLNIQRPDKIWPNPATRPSPAQLAALHRKDLWEKYEVRDPNDQNQVNDKISRYLHHCTEQRLEGKEWKVGEMFAELEPVMNAFENLLPDKSRPWGRHPSALVFVPGHVTLSTATPPQKTAVILSSPIRPKNNEP